MANSFGNELSDAGGDVVKGTAKIVVIGTGVLVAGSLGIYLIGKYVKERKDVSNAQQIPRKQPAPVVTNEEEWL